MVWVQIAMLVVSMVVSYVRRPKPRAAVPAGLGDVTVPTAEDGREAPVLFGTKITKAPNVVYYGAFAVEAIRKKP